MIANCKTRENSKSISIEWNRTPNFFLYVTWAQSKYTIQLNNKPIGIYCHEEWILLVYKDLSYTFKQPTLRMAAFQAQIKTHYSLLNQISQTWILSTTKYT